MTTLLTLLLALSPAPDTDSIVEAATAKPAVGVHIGCGDGTLTAKLAANGNLLVHGLEPDGKNVAAARKLLLERGLYGQATVEPWTSATLPHLEPGLRKPVIRQVDPVVWRITNTQVAGWIERIGFAVNPALVIQG